MLVERGSTYVFWSFLRGSNLWHLRFGGALPGWLIRRSSVYVSRVTLRYYPADARCGCAIVPLRRTVLKTCAKIALSGGLSWPSYLKIGVRVARQGAPSCFSDAALWPASFVVIIARPRELGALFSSLIALFGRSVEQLNTH